MNLRIENLLLGVMINGYIPYINFHKFIANMFFHVFCISMAVR
jgi:hypothetical protein